MTEEVKDTDIKGYSPKTKESADKANAFKSISAEFCAAIDEEIAQQSVTGELRESQIAIQWLIQARSDIQVACMKACRAVFKPDDSC